MELKKVNTKQLIKDLGFPEGTEFLGYSIHLEKSDEYLYDYKITPEGTPMTWAKTPEIAKCFKSFKKIEKIRSKIKPEAIIMWLFDTGTHIYATQPENYS